MSIIRVIASDPGSRNIAWSLLEFNTETLALDCINSIYFKSVGKELPPQYNSIAQAFKEYVIESEADIFVYEKPHFCGKAAMIGDNIQQVIGLLRVIAYRAGLEEFSYSPKEVKLYTTSNAKADKNIMVARAKQLFPNIVYKQDHAADATLIGVTYFIDKYKIKL